MERKIDFTKVRPYGDRLDDGITQVSFTLPVPRSSRGRRAALALAAKMGLERPEVVHDQELMPGFSYYIIYGKNIHSVDYTALIPDDSALTIIDKGQVESFIDKNIGREIVVVGASTGNDAHTIGLDAILNLKGFNGQPGLEGYRGFKVYNLGGQVPNEVFVAKAREVHADVLMVAQTVTEQNLHIYNMTNLVDLLEAEGMRDQVLLICGGFQISNELAKEIGFDHGFSKGCYPGHVASYIMRELSYHLQPV